MLKLKDDLAVFTVDITTVMDDVAVLQASRPVALCSQEITLTNCRNK